MKDKETGRMTIWGLLKAVLPYVLPYKWLITITLTLTLVGSLMAQVNAVVLDRAVDSINNLIQMPGGFSWGSAARLLTIISIILLGKEVIGAMVTFFQRYYGERMRILVTVASGCRSHVVVSSGFLYNGRQRDGETAISHRSWHHESEQYR